MVLFKAALVEGFEGSAIKMELFDESSGCRQMVLLEAALVKGFRNVDTVVEWCPSMLLWSKGSVQGCFGRRVSQCTWSYSKRAVAVIKWFCWRLLRSKGSA